jgi:hypothetical protein
MGDGPPIREGQILVGPLFNEPMRIETVRPGGTDTWIVGLVGTQTERFRNVTLSLADLKELKILEPTCSYKGDGQVLRLGLQAYALGIAYPVRGKELIGSSKEAKRRAIG